MTKFKQWLDQQIIVDRETAYSEEFRGIKGSNII